MVFYRQGRQESRSFSIKVCDDLQNLTCVDQNLKRYLVPLGSLMREEDPDGLIIFFDDTFDYGTEPLPKSPEAQRVFDELEKKYRQKKRKGESCTYEN